MRACSSYSNCFTELLFIFVDLFDRKLASLFSVGLDVLFSVVVWPASVGLCFEV